MIDVTEIEPSQLSEYDAIPMRALVESQFRVEIRDRGLGGLTLIEEPVSPPWTKDYEDGQSRGVARWLDQFDTANWGFFLARSDRQLAGAATVASRSGGKSGFVCRRLNRIRPIA